MNSSPKYNLTIQEYAKREGVSKITVKRRIWNKEIPIIKVKRDKGYRRNHVSILINYTNLSNKDAQDAFLRDRNLLPSEDKKAPDGDEKRIFLDLTEKQKRRFANKDAAQKEVVQALSDAPQGKRGIIISKVANSFGISPRTLYRDLKKVKQDGGDSLIPGWHRGQRPKAINNEIASIIDNLYLKDSRPSIKEVCETLKKSHNIKIPYPTVVRYINIKYTPGQQLLFRDPEEWNKKFSPYVRRDWSKVAVNEIWIGDQKQLDVPCVFRGRVIFPWVTVFMDMASRAYVGWILTAIPDAWAVSQALVYGVRKLGPPGTVYLDRGKQYKAKAISGGKVERSKVVRLFKDIKDTIIPGIFGELGIEIFWAAPYNAREKPIEPSFRVFNRLRHLFPGYRGPYVTKRPKDHAKLLKSAKLPSLEEMAQGVDTIVTEYNERVHSETNRSPNSFFSNFKRVIPSEKLLAFLLLVENHVTARDSTVTVDGLVYRHDDLWKLAGELVEVRRDPQNIQRAAIIYQNRVFCFATLEVPGHYRSPRTLESVKTTRRIRRQVSKWRKSVLEHEGAIENPLTYAVDLEEMEIIQSRDIQPPDSKITRIHQREKLARKTIEGIKREDEEVQEANKAAVGGRLTLDRLLVASETEKEKRPRIQLIGDSDLELFDHDEEDFFDE
jgi:transposase